MALNLVLVFWVVIAVYAGLGACFALYFVFRGVGRIDPVAQKATWGFRVLIFPGCAAFWPFLLRRLWQGREWPPEEKNAHRQFSMREKGQKP